MIEIDLLPLQLRKKIRIPFERIFKIKFIFFVLAGIVIFHLFLQAISVVNTIRLNRLKKKWQDLSFKRTRIEQINSELAKINEKTPLIEQLISKRILWSKKLNQISDLIISGVWLNKLTIEKQEAETKGEFVEYLIIQGSTASRTKDEPALIGRFMQSLKDDPSFSADFSEIELGPIKKRQIAQTEVMDFILICRFKQN